MSAASHWLRGLNQQTRPHRILPIFRKSGSRVLGAKAFTRAKDIEAVMEALPILVDIVEAAERLRADCDPSLGADLDYALGSLSRLAKTPI